MKKINEYQLTIHSRARLIIAMFVLLISSSEVMDRITFVNKLFSILFFICIYTLSFYLASLFASAKIKVIFKENSFLHIWEQRFFMSWEKDHEIPWNAVDHVGLESDRTLDSIIVTLTNQTNYKISKLNLFPARDDFSKLEKDFPKQLKNFRKEQNEDNG